MNSENEDGFEYSREDQFFRNKISELVTKETLTKFRAIDQSKTIIDSLFVVIILGVGLTLSFSTNSAGLNIPGIVLGSFICGIGFNWLNVQIHEASHFLLFRNQKLNDYFANYFYGSFGLQSVNEYRVSHITHHAHLNEESDPDSFFYQERVNTKLKFTLFIVFCFLGGAFLRKLFKGNWVPGSEDSNNSIKFNKILGILIHTLVISTIFVSHGFTLAFAYTSTILLSLICFFPVLLAIRTWVQHRSKSSLIQTAAEMVHRKFTSRTTVASFLEKLLIGARMDYHFEHHLFSRIPHYNLVLLHDLLIEKNFFDLHNINDLSTENYVKKSFQIA
jgi:fatty acid desaturase